jgi:phosphoglycerate kinase
VRKPGFNVAPDLKDTSRIDSELGDIDYLAAGGARVAILSHQGSYREGTARELDDVADYISQALHRPVAYSPDNISDNAFNTAVRQRPGGITVFGNSRRHRGEETNDRALAERFARLGDFVAVGGFSKGHRRHASNVGILDHLPGWPAQSLFDEIAALTPWLGRMPDTRSMAVLGGVKPEKTLLGLTTFAQSYDVVVPGGVVLHHVLHELGYDIGDSMLGDLAAECANATRSALRCATARLHVPSRVIVAHPTANGYAEPTEIPIAAGVRAGRAIVDFCHELGSMPNSGAFENKAVA